MKSKLYKAILVGALLAVTPTPASAGSDYTDSQITEFTQGGSIEIKLSAGEHTLLIEVSNAGGDWGFVLRFVRHDGVPLELTPEGRLVPLLGEGSP